MKEKIKSIMDKMELYPCPCNAACMCLMDEPCLGCEDYSKWLRKRNELNKDYITLEQSKESSNEFWKKILNRI